MPKMGYDMTEGKLLRWLVSEGDAVEAGDVLGEIETGKVDIEIEAFDSGVLRKLLVPEGETVAVGTPIAIIGAADEDIASVASARSSQPRPVLEEAQAPASGGAAAADGSGALDGAVASGASGHAGGAAAADESIPVDGAMSGSASRPRSSPLARRLAAERGLRLDSVVGTGPNGRIVRDDVLAAVASREAAVEPAGSGGVDMAATARPRELTRLRRTIAERLTRSWATAPHIFVTMAVDMTDALALRAEVNEVLAGRGATKVTVNDLVLKAVAQALRTHPELNSSWIDDGWVQHERVHLGVAVALEDGLATIVVPNADMLSVAEIAQVVADKSARARAGALSSTDVAAASTFTVSNLGMYGVEEFTAILNPPEAGILAVGAALPEPAVRDGEVVVRTIMRATLSADHRVVDGASAAEFLVSLRQALEKPTSLLL